MKGIDIVVQGNIGHMSAFMAQSGNLVVLGDAGDALGDSIYEAGSSCAARSKPRRRLHREGDAGRASRKLPACSTRAGVTDVKPEEFKRYGSARKLYNFNIDNADAY
jgi:hypothetical protein